MIRKDALCGEANNDAHANARSTAHDRRHESSETPEGSTALLLSCAGLCLSQKEKTRISMKVDNRLRFDRRSIQSSEEKRSAQQRALENQDPFICPTSARRVPVAAHTTCSIGQQVNATKPSQPMRSHYLPLGGDATLLALRILQRNSAATFSSPPAPGKRCS